MKKLSKKDIERAAKFLSGVTEEELTALFPSWKGEQAAHILEGMSLEESWEVFVRRYAEGLK